MVEQRLTEARRRLRIAQEEDDGADWLLLRAVDSFRDRPSAETKDRVLQAMTQLASKRDMLRLWGEAVQEMEKEE